MLELVVIEEVDITEGNIKVALKKEMQMVVIIKKLK
jgi:hypothetical protein